MKALQSRPRLRPGVGLLYAISTTSSRMQAATARGCSLGEAALFGQELSSETDSAMSPQQPTPPPQQLGKWGVSPEGGIWVMPHSMHCRLSLRAKHLCSVNHCFLIASLYQSSLSSPPPNKELCSFTGACLSSTRSSLRHTLGQWFAQCGPQTSSNITWELVLIANLMPHFRPSESETLGMGPSKLCFYKPSEAHD